MRGEVLVVIADSDGIAPWTLMVNANLSWRSLTVILDDLQGAGLVRRQRLKRRHGGWKPFVHQKRARWLYSLTEDGYRVAKTYIVLRGILLRGGHEV